MRYKKGNLRYRPGDWIFYDDITGFPYYASQSTKLGKYTGLQGLRTGTPHKFKPVGGLQPYKVPAEKPVPWSRPKNIHGSYSIKDWDPEETDPMSISNPEDEL